MKQRKWRRLAMCAVIVIVTAFSARLLSNFRFFQILHLKASDAQFAIRGQVPVSNIVLLVADQKALDTFHELLIFWHPYYAQAIRAAGESGARVIGLDLAFGVPVDKWEPDHDRLLAEAVSTSPVPVVCGYIPLLNTNQGIAPIPINMISAALGLSGYANLTADPDDFLRRQELMEAPSANAADPPLARSLAMRVAEKFAGQDATLQNGRMTFQGHAVPISPERRILINYAGPPGTFPRVSLADFIAAARAGQRDQLRKWVDGKIVLIGSDHVEDRWATPFYTLLSGPKWTTAGVEVHANTIRTVLERKYLQDVPEWVRAAVLVLAAAITAAVVVSLPASRAIPALILEVLGIIAITQLLFRFVHVSAVLDYDGNHSPHIFIQQLNDDFWPLLLRYLLRKGRKSPDIREHDGYGLTLAA